MGQLAPDTSALVMDLYELTMANGYFLQGGKRLEKAESLEIIRERVRHQLDTEVWAEEQRFENPHGHYLDMTPDYYAMKMKLMEEIWQ